MSAPKTPATPVEDGTLDFEFSDAVPVEDPANGLGDVERNPAAPATEQEKKR